MIEYAALSRKGVSRETNEDSYAVLTEPDSGSMAFIIADGMGGHNSGEIASRHAVAHVSDRLKTMVTVSEDKIQKTMEDIFDQANSSIYTLSLENPVHAGMGTTLSVAYLSGNRLYIGHVGDSRIYLVRDGVIKLLTLDHTYVEELIRNGSISRSQAMNHPGHNIITKAVGIIPDVKADIYFCDIIDTDIMFLCTDGLTKSVTEDEMIETVLAESSLESICEKLLGMADSRGGQDDATVIAVRYKSDVQ